MAARKQDSEEANALINFLQGRTEAQAQRAVTSSTTLEAIMAVQEDLKSRLQRSSVKPGTHQRDQEHQQHQRHMPISSQER